MSLNLNKDCPNLSYSVKTNYNEVQEKRIKLEEHIKELKKLRNNRKK